MATRKQRKAKQALMGAGGKRSRKPAPAQAKKSSRSSTMSARRSGAAKRSSAASASGQSQRRRNGAPDAISLLRQDHREVEALFAQLESAGSRARKRSIVENICDALTVHATIEEEIFYPQAREMLKRSGEDLLDEAEVEHEGIKWRIELIQNMRPEDDLYDAEVKCLKEYVEHHVKEEERKLFPKLRLSGFDSTIIGQQLAARKEEMTGKPVKEEPSFIERGLRAITGQRHAAPPPD
jgi:hemerythrin superfamily protein